MNFLKNVGAAAAGMVKATATGFNYDVDEPGRALEHSMWTLHSGKSRVSLPSLFGPSPFCSLVSHRELSRFQETGNLVSIFACNSKTESEEKVAAARNGMRRLKESEPQHRR